MHNLQNLFLYCGYNFYTEGPARLIGFARRLRSEFNDLVPVNENKLMTFNGIEHKVCMLIRQDAHMKPLGIVCDHHVKDFLFRIKWTRAKTADAAVEEVEGWLPQKYFRALNELVAGISQLWDNTENRQSMVTVAQELHIVDEVCMVAPDFDREKKRKRIK